jgi:hypothetical protein
LFAARNVYGQLLPAISLVLLLLTPALCPAQSPPPQPLLNARYQEFVSWLDAYERWEAWALKWGNRVAFNAAGSIIKTRPARPDPPEWLWEDCRSVIAAEGRLARACEILSRWQGLSHLLLNGTGASIPPSDIVPKSSFLQRVHLSGGWVPAQLPAPKIYLAAGMQVGIVEIRRLTLPAVGVGLIALADGQGGYEWKPATLIGLGYRLTSFAFPWVNREANLHLNLARATVHGVGDSPLGLDPSQNLIGFSLTFAKR